MVEHDAETFEPSPTTTRTRLRRRKWLLGGAIVTVVGVASLWPIHKLLELSIEAAKQRASRCAVAIRESGEGDPADCRQRRIGFWLAQMLPTTRDAARQEQANIESMVLEYQLEFATLRDFDVEARDPLARALVELHRGEFVPERSMSTPFLELDNVGAHALMIELANEDASTYERSLALKTALLLGDWDSAGRIARMSAAGDLTLGQNAAIVACILGEPEVAAARLDEANRVWREYSDHTPAVDLVRIEAHCGLPRSSDEASASRTASDRAAVVNLYDPNATLDEGYYRHERVMWVARMAVAPRRPIVWDKHLSFSEVELIEELGSSTDMKLVPIVARTRDERPGAGGPVIVTELEAGARALADLFETAPSEHTFEARAQTIRPRESLAWGGYCLATMAAAERVWRGQLPEARAIYAVARELADSEDFRPFAVAGELPLLGLHALLDPATALRLARSIPDEDLAATPVPVQVMFRVQLALVYEQAGEVDRAIELVAGAVALLSQLPANDVMKDDLDAGTRFVHGALLVRHGRQSSLTVEEPEDLRGRAPTASEAFAWWWNSAQAEPSEQFRYRWRAGGESQLWLGLSTWAIGSAFELLAQSGPAERRDLWLDIVSSDIVGDPLDLIRARLAAAERLGDQAAVDRWRAREAGLLERLQDDRAAALYRLLD